MLDYIKQHPVISATVALGGAFVFYQLALKPSGGGTELAGSPVIYGGGSSGGDSAARHPAEIEASVNQYAIQAAAINAENQRSFELAMRGAEAASAYQIAQLNAATSSAQQVNAITGQLELRQLELGAEERLNTLSIESSERQNLAAISTQAETTRMLTEHETFRQQARDATSVALSQIASHTSLTYADMSNQAALGMAQIQADVTTTLAGFQSAVALQQVNVSRDIAMSREKTNRQGNVLGIIGSVLGGLF